MKVDKEKAKRVFRLVRDLEEVMKQYCVEGGQSIPVPWENVATAVEQMTNIRITVKRKLVETEEPNGMVLRYDDGSADILVRPKMPDDLDNYTIIKEAMHPLVDEATDLSTDVVGTLTMLVKSSWFGKGNGDDDMDPILQSEHLATIAAAAVVVRRDRRAGYMAALTANTTTLAKIAVELNAPEPIVELALDPLFSECCEEALAAEPELV
jgi:hypothetical protein